MPNELPATMRQIRSLVTADGNLELSIATVDMPQPAPHEVLVRVEAAPINPSDLGLLLATADLDTATETGTADNPSVTATIPPQTMRGLAGRSGQSMPVGNEGAGVVVAAGSSDEAQALLGRTVGDHRRRDVRGVPLRSRGAVPRPARRHRTRAGCVVLRQSPHRARHGGDDEDGGPSAHSCTLPRPRTSVRCCSGSASPTAYHSSTSCAGRSRSRSCEISARRTCATPSSPTFIDDLTSRARRHRRDIAFDAIGGGRLVGQILACMEAAANATATEYSRYGSTTHKQVYIYGGLDRSPTEFTRNFGMAWGIGGWLLTPFLGKLGLEGIIRLRERVVAELTTTFASHYTDEVSLAGALSLDAIKAYARQATGQKFLIRPAT